MLSLDIVPPEGVQNIFWSRRDGCKRTGLSPPLILIMTHPESREVSTVPGRCGSEARTAHNMALLFKNQDKLTGKLGEDLTEHINNYNDAAQDYSLDQTNKLAFLYNIFDREARRFYREKMRDR